MGGVPEDDDYDCGSRRREEVSTTQLNRVTHAASTAAIEQAVTEASFIGETKCSTGCGILSTVVRVVMLQRPIDSVR